MVKTISSLPKLSIMMTMQLDQLRTQHPRFFYRSYAYQVTKTGLEISFLFHTHPELSFRPTLVINGVTEDHLARLSKAELDRYVFHIGLVEMLSYWKATCSPEIVIEAGALDDDQIEWWHDLLIKGLGEFFFVNQIDFTSPDFVTIVSTDNPSHHSAQPPTSETNATQQESFLIPIGGGKDSVVSLETLKRYAQEHSLPDTALAALMIHPTLAAQDCLQVSGLSRAIRIERTLDPLLAELNGQGYLNGHTPFSSLVAFISILVARLYGFTYVALSNEASSNEGNVEFHGQEINHQYSKTYEFEKKFQEYSERYVFQDLPYIQGYYFSLMRPLFELQIAKLFANHTEYHSIFRSCNRGRQTNAWCGECPKCLFAYTILYPFLGKDKMIEIFGQDLFTNAELLPIALELLGYAEKKPLECVGTHEENIAAFHMSYDRAQAEYEQLPILLEQVQNQVLSHEINLDARAKTILTSWNSQHFVPTKLELLLKSRLKTEA